MRRRVETKETASGNKIVVVHVNKDTDYVPKYSDLREIKRQLILLYGKEEVERETNPKFRRRHIYKYKFLREIKDDLGNRISLFEVVDTTTGKKRLTLKDETTGKTFPLSGSNIAVLLEEILSLSGGKGTIDLSEKEKWMLQILNERYAFGLVKML